MGRLIDADKLCESLIENISWLREQDYETYCAVGDAIVFVTDQQPTSYDPNKIVEQLEEIRVKKTCNKEKCDEKELCRICVVDDAIEIVKAGGNADLLIDRAKSKSGERIPYDGKWK